MRITHSTVAASARGRSLRYTRAIRASPASALKVRVSTGLCTTPPYHTGTRQRHAYREVTRQMACCGDLVKPSEFRTRGADGGVRHALRGWRPQAKAARAQGQQ